MSDAPAPSNSPAPSSEPLTGRAAEEHKHGYKPMPTDAPPPKRRGDDREFTGARDAADDLLGQRRREAKTAKPTVEVSYKHPDGGAADDRETVTVERAADDLKAFREANGKLAEVNAADDYAQQIDKLRMDNADVITGQPTEPNQPQLEQSTHISGLDADVSKALAHPQIREAIEQELGKAGQLQAQHSHHIGLANHFAQQALISAFPELMQYQLHEVAPVLDRMPPARREQAVAMLRRVAQGVEAQQHFEQQRAHAERQQFEVEARRQDAAFDKMIGPQTPAQRSAAANEMVAYAGELGIDRNTLVHLLQTNPILRHSAFQHMIHTAVSYRIAKREAMNWRDHVDRSAPHVQRPGHTNQRNASRGNENLQALARKASNSGSLKDMAALLAAKRRGRSK